MERRNFIKNTGLGIAGLALSNSIYSKNTSTKKSLETASSRIVSKLIKKGVFPQ